MSKNYFIYDVTGKILQSGFCPDDMLELQGASEQGRFVGEGSARDDSHYAVNGKLTERPENPATLTGLHLSNIPAPCAIDINGTSYPCTDTFADLSFTYHGTYKVTLKVFPYLDKVFTVTI